jgi:UDP-N-acetylglucosamine acyltransferase
MTTLRIDPSAQIHPMAVVEEGATIGAGCVVGPFAIIGPEVTLHDNVTVKPHALVTGWTEVGAGTTIFSFASVGEIPQDLKYAGERTRLIIGARCRIRENATLHLGTDHGGGVTRIGDGCLIMAGAHVGHDAQIGNNVILANYVGIAGHVRIADNVIIGALSGVHQFVRIGEGAMIGGLSRVTHDVMPFALVAGPDAEVGGLNLIGLKRRGVSRDDISALRAAYKRLASSEGTLTDAALSLLADAPTDGVERLARFFTEESGRNFLRPK